MLCTGGFKGGKGQGAMPPQDARGDEVNYVELSQENTTKIHVSKLSLLLIKVLILEPGNKFKIFPEHVSYNLRKYFFSNWVIQTWNSLPRSIKLH